MKKKLSKIEIATYLKDYSDLILSAGLNANQNLFELFTGMLISNGRGQYAIKEYYFDMISVYEFFLLNKTYSFMADNLFDYLLENNLSDINIPEDIFIDKNDYNKFSKKQIIKFIRNAINHNDHDDRDLYNLYIDSGELKIEIFLQKTKPIPFHIEMTIHDYMNIMNGLWKANKIDLIKYQSKSELNLSSDNLTSELDKIFYRRYYYKSKIDNDILNKIKEEKDRKKYVYKLEENLSKDELSYIDYFLTIPQKLKILEDFKNWKDLLSIDENMSIDYLVPNVIPLGITKIKQLRYGLVIADFYVKSCKKSFMDMISDARDIYLNKANKDNILYEDNLLEKDYKLVMCATDFDYHASLAFSIYASYLFDTLITDENIKIGDNNYPREKIRDSFVHGRWFNGINGCFKLYDCDNGDKNDLNYNWRASIPYSKLYLATNNYYEKSLKENKDSNFLYSSPTIRINESGKPISIMLTKDDRSYLYNINIETYNEDCIPWGLYDFYGDKLVYTDSENDINLFFNELEKALIEENPDYKSLANFFRYQNQICLLYKKGKLSLDVLKSNDEWFTTSFINKYGIENNNNKQKH